MRSSAARAYSLLFFLSGATGLVYELLWVRVLSQTFGSTIQSVTTVVTAYMGGLGLGAWLFGRRADRHPRPAALYGVLEIAIAAFGLISPLVLGVAHRLYIGIAGSLPLGEAASVALRFGLAALVLLVPTTLMGGTLPVLTGAFMGADRGQLKRSLALLYGLNTIGAMPGRALAGFFLTEYVGIRLSLGGTAAVNLGWGVGAIALARSMGPMAGPAAEGPAQGPAGAMPGGPASSATRRLRYVAFALLALTAFASLLDEIAWTRVLVMVVGGSTYAFTLVLLVFLLGIGLGSGLVARRGAARRATLADAALAQGITGAGARNAAPRRPGGQRRRGAGVGGARRGRRRRPGRAPSRATAGARCCRPGDRDPGRRAGGVRVEHPADRPRPDHLRPPADGCQCPPGFPGAPRRPPARVPRWLERHGERVGGTERPHAPCERQSGRVRSGRHEYRDHGRADGSRRAAGSRLRAGDRLRERRDGPSARGRSGHTAGASGGDRARGPAHGSVLHRGERRRTRAPRRAGRGRRRPERPAAAPRAIRHRRLRALQPLGRGRRDAVYTRVLPDCTGAPRRRRRLLPVAPVVPATVVGRCRNRPQPPPGLPARGSLVFNHPGSSDRGLEPAAAVRPRLARAIARSYDCDWCSEPRVARHRLRGRSLRTPVARRARCRAARRPGDARTPRRSAQA